MTDSCPELGSATQHSPARIPIAPYPGERRAYQVQREGDDVATTTVISSGWVSNSRVEPSTPGSSNITVPVGTWSRPTLLKSVTLTLTSIGSCASLITNEMANR
ncbi:hypothetical protein [Mycobacterium scrofulaceum]|uniref:hypothetical protein n=1 Tax=Mycobacterium scrofulaceum TaxID=1783 RepID=UPI0012E99F40|nr:hypothetical protein [Mycobacterium scrofulaceum]